MSQGLPDQDGVGALMMGGRSFDHMLGALMQKYPEVSFGAFIRLRRFVQVAFGEVLGLPFSSILAVSKGASQGQSIYLILRSSLAQKRAVSKEVI